MHSHIKNESTLKPKTGSTCLLNLLIFFSLLWYQKDMIVFNEITMFIYSPITYMNRTQYTLLYPKLICLPIHEQAFSTKQFYGERVHNKGNEFIISLENIPPLKLYYYCV